jgi:hypothetical protein
MHNLQVWYLHTFKYDHRNIYNHKRRYHLTNLSFHSLTLMEKKIQDSENQFVYIELRM